MSATILESCCIVDQAGRAANFKINSQRGLPEIKPVPIHEGKLAIVGSGPSVSDRLRDLREWSGEVWAINGAYDYLLENGVVPDGFFAIDPLPTLADYVQNPQPETRFYIASTCHPDVFDAIDGYDVWLVHQSCEDDLAMYGKGVGPIIFGGTTSVTRAPYLAAMLGYRDITLFGVDGSYTSKGPYCYHWGSFKEDIKNPVIPVMINGEGPFMSEIGLLKQITQLGFILRVLNKDKPILKIDPQGLMGAFMRSPYLDDSGIEIIPAGETKREPTSFHAANPIHFESDQWLTI